MCPPHSAQATGSDRGVCFNQPALCFSRLNQPAKAVALYHAAVAAGTDRHKDAYLWYNNMRTSLEKLNMLPEAIIACRKVIELSPSTLNGQKKRDQVKLALLKLERGIIKIIAPLEIPEILPESQADRGEWIARSKVTTTSGNQKKKVDIAVAVPVLKQIESTASDVNGLSLALLCLGRCVAAKLAIYVLARLPADTPPLFRGPAQIDSLLGFCVSGFDAIVDNVCSTAGPADMSALSEPQPETSLPPPTSADVDYLVDSMLAKAKLAMVESQWSSRRGCRRDRY